MKAYHTCYHSGKGKLRMQSCSQNPGSNETFDIGSIADNPVYATHSFQIPAAISLARKNVLVFHLEELCSICISRLNE